MQTCFEQTAYEAACGKLRNTVVLILQAKGPGNAGEPLMAVLVETHCSEKERGSKEVRKISG